MKTKNNLAIFRSFSTVFILDERKPRAEQAEMRETVCQNVRDVAVEVARAVKIILEGLDFFWLTWKAERQPLRPTLLYRIDARVTIGLTYVLRNKK
jgi:hypothetical protein